MTSKDSFQAHVHKLVELFRAKLHLHEWSYKLHFDVEARKRQTKWAEGSVMAEISINPAYLRFDIGFSEEFREPFKAGQSYEVARTIMHELAHVITEPLYIIAVDAVTNTSNDFLLAEREKATERIANAVLSQLPKESYAIKRRRS